LENLLPRIVDWVDANAMWIYAVCAVGLLIAVRVAWVARRAKRRAVFKLEREVAVNRESRAISVAALLIGVLVTVTAIKFYVAPTVEAVPPTPTATPTSFLFEDPPTREIPTTTPTVPLPTPTRRPIRRTIAVPVPPTATSPPAVLCADPSACIKSPAPNAQISGAVQVIGTANIDRFQFYKVEYGQGEDPQQWHSTSDIHRAPVVDGLLDVWNTTGFPAGVYKLRLVVVDATGNFQPPHVIRVVIQN
jgi:hypothetical protein